MPHIVFTKGGGLWLEEIAAAGADVVGVDWTVDLGAARARVGDRRRAAGQPRSDRAVRRRPTRSAPRSRRALDSFAAPAGAALDGHVFNLGHGISQHTPPENVAVLVDAVHELSRALRTAHRA